MAMSYPVFFLQIYKSFIFLVQPKHSTQTGLESSHFSGTIITADIYLSCVVHRLETLSYNRDRWQVCYMVAMATDRIYPSEILTHKKYYIKFWIILVKLWCIESCFWNMKGNCISSSGSGPLDSNCLWNHCFLSWGVIGPCQVTQTPTCSDVALEAGSREVVQTLLDLRDLRELQLTLRLLAHTHTHTH